jgi:hypothetical protein
VVNKTTSSVEGGLLQLRKRPFRLQYLCSSHKTQRSPTDLGSLRSIRSAQAVTCEGSSDQSGHRSDEVTI